MPLGAPAVVGPVSTCSTSVRVVGQFSGSRVRVFIEGDPNPLGDAAVTWSDAFVAVDRSRLVADKRLVATQQLGSETSPKSPTGQKIEEAVNDIVTLPYKIYRCAQSVFVADCCPGARIDVLQNGVLLGSAVAVADQAWIDFLPNQRIEANHPLEIRQTICTSATPVSTFSAKPLKPPVIERNRLASPTIVEPLEECQRAVPLTGIVEGATAHLRRRGQPIYDGSVPVPAVNVLTEALRAGEELAVAQSMLRCELWPGEPDKATVQPLTALKRPRIDGPLCKGPHQVIVSRLKPGATVRLFRGNTEIGRWEAPAQSMPIDVNVPGPATITARQELCGIVSPKSRPYTVATARSGRWFSVEDEHGADLQAKAFAIHAGLVHTGHIVIFSGDQHNEAQHEADPQNIDHCELFDCADLTIRKIDAPTTDVFCSGHAFLPDGRLLVAGGTQRWLSSGGAHDEHFPGLRSTWIFSAVPDAKGRHWTKAADMKAGRWYPTLVTLRDGRVLALSGHPAENDGRHNNNTLERWTGNGWQDLGDSPDIDSGESTFLYPRIFAGPTGGVFSATPILSEAPQIPRRSATWPGTGLSWNRSATPVAGFDWGLYRDFNAPAVLLPLIEEADAARSYRFRVLLAGDREPWIADLGALAAPEPAPRWVAMGPRTRRLNSSLVLLPSGEVLLCGGVGNPEDDATAVLDPEMLIPAGADWQWDTQRFARAKVARNYHSTALLMPDGRVFTGGSNVDAAPADASGRRLEIEIYEPWYVCRPRPRILSAADRVRPGERLIARVKSSEPVARLVLMRAGSATHAFNPDQRCISMIARRVTGREYAGIVPPPAVAIPGYYLLFALTDKGVPSRGRFVRIEVPS